jgi:hypothetical protein
VPVSGFGRGGHVIYGTALLNRLGR